MLFIYDPFFRNIKSRMNLGRMKSVIFKFLILNSIIQFNKSGKTYFTIMRFKILQKNCQSK